MAFKGRNNASYQLVDLINPKERFFLTNSFSGIEKDLSTINLESYDWILMFGVNKYLKDKLVIEVKARYNDILRETSIDYTKLYSLISEKKIDVEVNNNASMYLCNYAYYHVLLRNQNTVFIHIPGLSKISDINKLAMLFKEK